MRAVRPGLLLLYLATALGGAGRPASAQVEAPAAPSPAQGDDEKAIRDLIAGFVSAFERGDAPAIAALFEERGEAVDLDGNAIQGRPALEAHYAGRFEAEPGRKLATEIESIQFLAPGVARQDGRSKVADADGGSPSSFRYTATLLKGDRGWKIASLRELEDPLPSHHERLKDLEWLVGDWVEETGDAVIATSMGWSEDGNFLLRSYEIRVEGRPTLKGSQRIGWDPLTKQVKSWVFDSRGAYGEGF